jgi:hypothetical protein
MSIRFAVVTPCDRSPVLAYPDVGVATLAGASGCFDDTRDALGMLGVHVTSGQIERSARAVDGQEREAGKV